MYQPRHQKNNEIELPVFVQAASLGLLSFLFTLAIFFV